VGNAWEEFTPFLRFDTEIRRIVCTTNAIESVNARIRRAVKARGYFPNEQAALECVYVAIVSLDPTGKGQTRWTTPNAFDTTFDGRRHRTPGTLPAARAQPDVPPRHCAAVPDQALGPSAATQRLLTCTLAI
jgi:hypothetical protein